MSHVPVLLQEIVGGLDVHEGHTVVDATLGRAGHARALGEYIGRAGLLVGIDADGQNVRDGEVFLSALPCKVHLHVANFRNIAVVCNEEGIPPGGVHRVLFDLGLNSLQLESSGRGFSFQVNEPLLMTLTDLPAAHVLTAQTIVNEWSRESLEAILRGFGGEQFAGRIARVITLERRMRKIMTTFDLVACIEKAVPNFYKHRKIHPATKTFQALRIAVNDEFGALKEALISAWHYLAPGGRIAVISFHEGEDRIVKQQFAEYKQTTGVLITKKPIIPTRTEVRENPRSRSAKLRIIEKRS